MCDVVAERYFKPREQENTGTCECWNNTMRCLYPTQLSTFSKHYTLEVICVMKLLVQRKQGYSTQLHQMLYTHALPENFFLENTSP